MIVTFEDADGRRGKVTEELNVEYDGEWDQDVRELVDDVREAHQIDDDDVMDGEVVDALVIELPKEPKVVEAERHDR